MLGPFPMTNFREAVIFQQVVPNDSSLVQVFKENSTILRLII